MFVFQYKYQAQLNTAQCVSPQLEQHNRRKSKPFNLQDKISDKTPWQFFNCTWLYYPAVKIWCSAGQSEPRTCYFFFTVPERKTNCTLNKTWAMRDVVTVWQKPSFWPPAKPDQGDLTPKACLFLKPDLQNRVSYWELYTNTIYFGNIITRAVLVLHSDHFGAVIES